MKKIISILLALVLILGCIPAPAFAAESGEVCAVEPYSGDATLLEIVRDGAPIRTGAGEKYAKVVTCEKGAVLEKNGSKVNRYLNKWYEVTYRDMESNACYTGYIYSENVKKHSHSFEKLEYEGVTYKFCDCGKITVRVKNEYMLKKADALAAAGVAAGTLTAVDGPLPVGDLIGAGLLVTVGLLSNTGALPNVREVLSIYDDIDFKRFEEDDSCSADSYRKVVRSNGTLIFLDDKCMSVVEAYVWVRTGNDVWCQNWDTALKLGALHPGGCFSEIDSGNKDYWYHFHLGSCTPEGKHVDVVGGHIFYGASAITHSYPY